MIDVVDTAVVETADVVETPTVAPTLVAVFELLPQAAMASAQSSGATTSAR
jgi:hypothetical protein